MYWEDPSTRTVSADLETSGSMPPNLHAPPEVALCGLGLRFCLGCGHCRRLHLNEGHRAGGPGSGQLVVIPLIR